MITMNFSAMAPYFLFSFLSVFLHHVGSANVDNDHSYSNYENVKIRNKFSSIPRSNSHYVSDPCANPYPNKYLNQQTFKTDNQVSTISELLQMEKWTTNLCFETTNSIQTSPRFHSMTINSRKYSTKEWSPANAELYQAVLKVTILVMLKIIAKYYVRGHLKAYISSTALFEIVDLTSKALTIAIAKCAIKWAIYPALRTASKTLLIASLKSLLKPVTSRLTKGKKSTLEENTFYRYLVKYLLTLSVKVVTKTIALHLLSLVFEHEEMRLTLGQLMFRVSLIIMVKMSAKRMCKLAKTKKQPTDCGTTSAPVDKIMMFAIQKLVTKLVKIPLIKILL